MKHLAKLEEVALVVLSLYLFSLLPFDWWLFGLLFFAPDVSLIGQVVGHRIGAISYNVVHHKAVAVAAYVVGGLFGLPFLSLAGVVLLGHSSLDRVLGFDLLDADSPVPGTPALKPGAGATGAG